MIFCLSSINKWDGEISLYTFQMFMFFLYGSSRTCLYGSQWACFCDPELLLQKVVLYLIQYFWLLLGIHLVQINNNTSAGFKGWKQDELECGHWNYFPVIWRNQRLCLWAPRTIFFFLFFSSLLGDSGLAKESTGAKLWLSGQRFINSSPILILEKKIKKLICRRETPGRRRRPIESGLGWPRAWKEKKWLCVLIPVSGTCKQSQGSVTAGETLVGTRAQRQLPNQKTEPWSKFKVNRGMYDHGTSSGKISGWVCWAHPSPKSETFPHQLAPSCERDGPPGVQECCEHRHAGGREQGRGFSTQGKSNLAEKKPRSSNELSPANW